MKRKKQNLPAMERADIIEKLIKDGFVKREKKQMIPTEDDLKLITVLPDMIKSPYIDFQGRTSHGGFYFRH